MTPLQSVLAFVLVIAILVTVVLICEPTLTIRIRKTVNGPLTWTSRDSTDCERAGWWLAADLMAATMVDWGSQDALKARIIERVAVYQRRTGASLGADPAGLRPHDTQPHQEGTTDDPIRADDDQPRTG